jgi:hypothetical protein
MRKNCPVCNKVGLPDFKTNHVICPQCNSDLKPYLLIHSISKAKRKHFVILFSVIAVILLNVLGASYYQSKSLNKKRKSEQSLLIASLQNSIQVLQDSIKQIQAIDERDTSNNSIFIQYKVRKGDYPGKIAEFFYNDWKMYKQIEKDNNLQQPYILKVGQMLKISINQE